MDSFTAIAKQHFLVFFACLEKVIIDFKSYLINSLSTMLSLLLIFTAIYLGISMLAKNGNTFDPQQLIIDYIQWMFCIYCYQNIAESVVGTSRQGTIQKIYLSSVGYKWYLFYDSLSYLAIAFLEIIAVLIAIKFIFDSASMNILIRYLQYSPIMLLSLASILGLGYAFGGLALLLKKVSAFLYLFQYVFAMMLVFFRTESLSMYLMPYVYGAHLIRKMMAAGESLQSLSTASILILVVNSIVYLIVGLAIFSLGEKVVLKRGTLGHY